MPAKNNLSKHIVNNITLLAFIVLVYSLAYFLMFDFNEEKITFLECFILLWVLSMFVDEVRQISMTPVKNLGDGPIKTIKEGFGKVNNYLAGK